MFCLIFSLFSFNKYKHTGSVQTFTAPCATTYKLEVWGAQGAGNGVFGGIACRGGYGGYSIGWYSINNNIYIAVGQNRAPGYGSSYNGGGYGQMPGGGATSITTTNRGELYNYENYKSEVLLVAGGGGGADVGIGGYGGGASGGIGINIVEDNGTQGGTPGTGGTQTAGGTGAKNGSFGRGATGTTTGDGEGTGGGGWYGGGTGRLGWSTAGGGSGHIGNVINGQTIAGNQSFPSPTGGTETGHSGNGNAKITWMPVL